MARQSDRLEWEAEQARDEVAASLDQLRARLTPSQIVDEAVSYLRETPVADFGRNLVRDLREHPLPLLVIFAGVTWAIVASALSDRNRARISSATDTEPVPATSVNTTESTSSTWPAEIAPVSTRQEWEVAPLNETVE